MSETITEKLFYTDAAVPALAPLLDREKPAFLTLPDEDTLHAMEAQAAQWRQQAKYLIVLGTGGSSLSGEALAALKPHADTQLLVLDNCDLDSFTRVKAFPPQKCALLVISKSGTTLEVNAYLDLALQWFKAATDWRQRIAVITQFNGNVLHNYASQQQLLCFEHAADLCGRMSILSSVGLLPAAFMGLDIRALVQGARQALAALPVAERAAAWQASQLKNGKSVHTLFIYGPRFAGLARWWRQLIAESLGKDGTGFTPVLAAGTRDQHSQLQLYLDGPRDKLFTLITEKTLEKGEMISAEALLPAIHGKRLGDLIAAQQQATIATLVNHQLPLRHIECVQMDEIAAGHLLMQWMLEIAFLGHLLGVDAYTQPAVEESKRLTAQYLSK